MDDQRAGLWTAATISSSISDDGHELVTQTRARLAPFRRAQFRLPGRLAKSYDEHDAIVTAIMRADGPGASQAAQSHVSIVSDASAVFAVPLKI